MFTAVERAGDSMEYSSWSPPNQQEADVQTIAGLRARDDATVGRVLSEIRSLSIKWWRVPAEQADEIAAITIPRAWVQMDKFRGESSLRYWLMRIARNVYMDMLRLAKREVQDPPALEAAALRGAHWEDDLLRQMDVSQALGKLEDDEQRVIALRHRDGLSVAETSRLMGRSEDGVKSLMKRAKQKLGRLLAGWD